MAGKIWTDEEIDFIKENYKKLTAKEMSSILSNRTDRAVLTKMQRLGLIKIISRVSGKLWSEEEINFVKRNYMEYTVNEMASALEDRTGRSVSGLMQKLGLIKQIKNAISKTTNYKICPVCQQKKPKSEFYKATSRYDGIKAICKECCYIQYVKRKQNKKLEKFKSVIIANKEKSSKEQIKCSICGKVKPGTEYYFLSSTQKRDTKCIECTKEINKKQKIKRIINGTDW